MNQNTTTPEKPAIVEGKKIKENQISLVSPETKSLRYSDEDLQEFKKIVCSKLEEARQDYNDLKGIIMKEDDHGTDDTSPVFKIMEEAGDGTSREEVSQLAFRQLKFIESLQNALIRIENKTYGVCRVTGKLIAKERLRAVPHTTMCIDAKIEISRFN